MNTAHSIHDFEAVSLSELISRSARGEEAAFRHLVERHQGYVYALAFRLVCDDDDANDIVQDTFIRAWKHLPSYDPEVRFTTWLYKIAVNLSYDRLRARKRRRRWIFPFTAAEDPPPGDRTEEENIVNRDLAQNIRSLADHLPPKQRTVFLLRDVQDLSVEEVAQALSMSTSTVKANLSYARRAIRRRMEQLESVEVRKP